MNCAKLLTYTECFKKNTKIKSVNFSIYPLVKYIWFHLNLILQVRLRMVVALYFVLLFLFNNGHILQLKPETVAVIDR